MSTPQLKLERVICSGVMCPPPPIIVKLQTELYFPSCHLKRKSLRMCSEPNKTLLWGCVCAYVSLCLCFTGDCEMLSHSHLKRACWGTMETIPGVIFILNTTYSLPDSPSLSLSIPLTLPFNVFLTLVSLFFHTHTFAHRAERFPCLFFLN